MWPKKIIVLAAIVVAGGAATFFISIKPPGNDATFTRESAQEMAPDTQFYQSKDYGFTLEYPSELNLGEFYDEDHETIVFQKGNEKIGFQIFITSYAGGPITRETILKDLPSTIIKDPKEVIIGDGTRALIFWSESPELGKTREVWFARDGYLYEITTYAALDTWLANILKTWRWLE